VKCLLPFSLESLIFLSTVKKIKSKACKIIILSFVLYGCETWSPTLREEHRFRVYENMELKKILELKMRN